jgi:hypothetical protein
MIKGKHTRIAGGAKFWSGNTAMVGGLISKPVIINQQNFVSSPSMPSWLTLTRLSTATRFDSTGTLVDVAADTARFDYAYNGAAWAVKGLLLEKAATNIIPFSETLDTRTPSVVTGGIYSISKTQINGFSVYDISILNVDSPSTGIRNADFSTGLNATIPSITFSCVGQALSLDKGSSWLKIRAVSTVDSGKFSSTSKKLTYTEADNTSSLKYCAFNSRVGDLNIRVYGLQQEASVYSTSYIKTTTSAVTRAQDNLQLNASNYTGSVKLTYKRQDTDATESAWIDLANATNPILTNSLSVGIWLQNIAVYNRTLTAQEKANA